MDSIQPEMSFYYDNNSDELSKKTFDVPVTISATIKPN